MSYSYRCSWILDVKARFNDFTWSTHTLSSIFWSPARGTQSHLESQPSKTSVSSKSARSQKRSTQSPRWNTKENSMKYVNYLENYLKNSILSILKLSKSIKKQYIEQVNKIIFHQIPTLEQPISHFKLSFSALSDQKIERRICQSLAEIHSWHLAVELSQLSKLHHRSGE